MIEIKELRIGNWIIEHYSENDVPKERYFQIKSGADIDVVDGGFSGILLTPEILEKCGFKFIDRFFTNGKFLFSEGHIYLEIGSKLIPIYLCDCKYLHHFQNIIFDITNKELLVNLNTK